MRVLSIRVIDVVDDGWVAMLIVVSLFQRVRMSHLLCYSDGQHIIVGLLLNFVVDVAANGKTWYGQQHTIVKQVL